MFPLHFHVCFQIQTMHISACHYIAYSSSFLEEWKMMSTLRSNQAQKKEKMHVWKCDSCMLPCFCILFWCKYDTLESWFVLSVSEMQKHCQAADRRPENRCVPEIWTLLLLILPSCIFPRLSLYNLQQSLSLSLFSLTHHINPINPASRLPLNTFTAPFHQMSDPLCFIPTFKMLVTGSCSRAYFLYTLNPFVTTTVCKSLGV